MYFVDECGMSKYPMMDKQAKYGSEMKLYSKYKNNSKYSFYHNQTMIERNKMYLKHMPSGTSDDKFSKNSQLHFASLSNF